MGLFIGPCGAMSEISHGPFSSRPLALPLALPSKEERLHCSALASLHCKLITRCVASSKSLDNRKAIIVNKQTKAESLNHTAVPGSSMTSKATDRQLDKHQNIQVCCVH